MKKVFFSSENGKSCHSNLKVIKNHKIFRNSRLTIWKNGYIAAFAFWTILDGVSGRFESNEQLEIRASLVFSHLHKDTHGILLDIHVENPQNIVHSPANK